MQIFLMKGYLSQCFTVLFLFFLFTSGQISILKFQHHNNFHSTWVVEAFGMDFLVCSGCYMVFWQQQQKERNPGTCVYWGPLEVQNGLIELLLFSKTICIKNHPKVKQCSENFILLWTFPWVVNIIFVNIDIKMDLVIKYFFSWTRNAMSCCNRNQILTISVPPVVEFK